MLYVGNRLNDGNLGKLLQVQLWQMQYMVEKSLLL